MNTNDLLQIANEQLLTITNRPDIVITSGKGMYAYDSDGNKYLDFVAGWAVNSLGHSPKVIAEAINKQANLLLNASPAFYNEPMLNYAKLLTENSCFERAFFCSIGAEANEGAIKLARKFGQKNKNGAYEIITTQGSFHGRTLTTMSASGKASFEKLFEPKTPGFLKAKFNNLDSIKALVTNKTCAIMLEPIQGEGGVNVATPEFISGLRKLCDQENILLLFDEIQTGMGRTGKLFCYEHYHIEPDIMALAKGIGGGFPLAAVLAKENLNIFEAGEQGGTYTAQPLAMAVGIAVLNELINQDVIANCEQMSNLIFSKLHELAAHYEIDNIRGKGLLIGFDLQQSNGADIVAKCRLDGLLINSPQEKSIRLMPALIVKEAEIDELFVILKKHLQKKN